MKWKDFEVHQLIAIRGEIEEEFAKLSNKQGKFSKNYNFFEQKINLENLQCLGCFVWCRMMGRRRPWPPPLKHGGLLPQYSRVSRFAGASRARKIEPDLFLSTMFCPSLTYYYSNPIFLTLLSITSFIYITYLPSLCCFDISVWHSSLTFLIGFLQVLTHGSNCKFGR